MGFFALIFGTALTAACSSDPDKTGSSCGTSDNGASSSSGSSGGTSSSGGSSSGGSCSYLCIGSSCKCKGGSNDGKSCTCGNKCDYECGCGGDSSAKCCDGKGESCIDDSTCCNGCDMDSNQCK